jgi:hypothetical protein
MRTLRSEGQDTAKVLWTSAEPEQLARIVRRVRELDTAGATEWLDGFFQELSPREGPLVECSAVLFSARQNVRTTIKNYISVRERGLECRLAEKKPKALQAEITREIERRSRVPCNAMNRSEGVIPSALSSYSWNPRIRTQ